MKGSEGQPAEAEAVPHEKVTPRRERLRLRMATARETGTGRRTEHDSVGRIARVLIG